MLYTDVTKFKNIEQALRAYKKKADKVGIVKELRDRKEFEKPSVKRRAEITKAKYVQKKYRSNDKD